jgi:hypothetical protein
LAIQTRHIHLVRPHQVQPRMLQVDNHEILRKSR